MMATLKEYGPGEDGYIWAYYVTTTENQSVKLLYSKSGFASTMIVDGESVPTVAGNYTFAEPDEHLVKLKITGNVTHWFRDTEVRKVYFPYQAITFPSGNFMFYNTQIWILRIPGPSNGTPRLKSAASAMSADNARLSDIEALNVSALTGTFISNNIKNLVVKGTFRSIPASFATGFNSVSNFQLVWYKSPNLTSVGKNFCRYMPRLVNLVMEVDTPPTINTENMFQSNGGRPTNIYVPYSADHSILDAWKAASGWSTYASRMKELTPDGEIPTA